jgi:hypothetical protein
MSNRTLFTRETGHIVYDAAGTPSTFFAQGSISLELVMESSPLMTMMFGEIDKIVTGKIVKLKFIPLEFSAGAAATLFPFGGKALGSSIFESSDKTIDIHTTSGLQVRLLSAAVYAEPGIQGDITKTVFGTSEWWGILPISGDPSTLAAYLTETSVSYPGASAFDQTKAITPAWACAWGASPFDAIDLDQSGWELKTTPKLVEDRVQGKGLVNIALADYSMSVTFAPMNVTRAQAMARMGWGIPVGGRASAAKADWIASGTGIYVAAYNMAPASADPFQFDSSARTVGKITLASTKTITAGARASMLYIGAAAPES